MSDPREDLDNRLVGLAAVISRYCDQQGATLGEPTLEALTLQLELAKVDVLWQIEQRLAELGNLLTRSTMRVHCTGDDPAEDW